MHLPCIITGDFNVTISPEEKKGGSNVRDPFGERLKDLISSWNLVNIKQRKGKCTWNNKRSGHGHIAAILDHILVSSSLLDNPLIPVSRLLTSYVSDHKPIMFSLKPIENLGPHPFNFPPIWLTKIGFHDVFSQAWGIFFHGSPAYIWEHKLKNVKKEIKYCLAGRPHSG